MEDKNIMDETYEVETTDDTNECVESEVSSGIAGKVIAGLLLAGGATAAWLIATKDKRKQKRIDRAFAMLEAEGYSITSDCDVKMEGVEVVHDEKKMEVTTDDEE